MGLNKWTFFLCYFSNRIKQTSDFEKYALVATNKLNAIVWKNSIFYIVKLQFEISFRGGLCYIHVAQW